MEKESLRKRLTSIQWKVTQENETERPYTSSYTNLNKKGNYFCIVCSALLFESTTKFHSGCG